jgi:hypothetical protein
MVRLSTLCFRSLPALRFPGGPRGHAASRFETIAAQCHEAALEKTG